MQPDFNEHPLEMVTQDLKIESGDGSNMTCRGDFVGYVSGSGSILYVTTDKGQTFRLKKGDGKYLEQPFTSLTLRSSAGVDNITLTTGFGWEFQIGRDIGQRIAVVDSNGQQQDVRSVDGRSVDVVSEPSKFDLSETGGSLVRDLYLNAETQSIALRMNAMGVTGPTNYLLVTLFSAGNDALAGYPARIYNMADRTWSDDGKIFAAGNYLVDTRGASLMKLDGTNLDAADLPNTQTLALLNFTLPVLDKPDVRVTNITGIANPGQYFIDAPTVPGKKLVILGYLIEFTANATVAGSATGTPAFMYDNGGGLVNSPFAHDCYVSDAPAGADYLTIRQPIRFKGEVPEGGWKCPNYSGIVFDFPFTLATGTCAVMLFARDE